MWPEGSTVHGGDGLCPVLEVDEGVVLDLLDPLDVPVLQERLSDLVFRHHGSKVAHVQYFNLSKGSMPLAQNLTEVSRLIES